ncbi:MAG: penicillin-binding protein 2 [bacterium]
MKSILEQKLRLVPQRLIVFAIIILIAFFIMFVRLFQLQIIKGASYRKVSEENRTQITFTQAPRGNIFDNDGKLLVGNKPSFTLTFTPDFFSRDLSISRVSEKLSYFLKTDSQKLLKNLEQANLYPFKSSRIKTDIDRDVAFYISERHNEFPGFSIQVEPIRDYKYLDFASHVIGYMGEISRDQMFKLETEIYRMGDLIGKSGVERVHDALIRGKDGGTAIEVSAAGKQVRVLQHINSQRGNDVMLSIDFELQRIAEEVMGNKHGSIVFIDPSSGAIRALVSKPDFDPNVFLRPLESEQARYLLRSNDKPLFNRATQAQYAPGSVFKIITAIAALEEGVLSPKDTFECTGEFKVGKQERIFRCWKEEGHKKVNMIKGLGESCDVYFYNVGLMLSRGTLPRYARYFGLGDETGIDLPGEKKGIVPDRAWKKKLLNEGWWDGDTVNMSIGQGYLWVTPLQMANLVAAVANGGDVWQPYLVKEIISPDGKILQETEPKLKRKITIKPDTWKVIKEGMRYAVTKGTAQAVNMRKLPIAAKTGTAENPQGEDHAWFAGYAPFDKPELAFVVFVEHGGHGGVVAAPIAREILDRYYGLEEQKKAVDTREVRD